MTNSLYHLGACSLLVLSQLSAFAQDAGSVAPAPAVGLLAPPPVRRWVMSSGPFSPSSGLRPNLRIEYVARPRLAGLLEVDFLRNQSNFGGTSWRSVDGGLSVGIRRYFGTQAPKGFYVEALIGATYFQSAYAGRESPRYVGLQPQLGAGYQLFIGRRHRFVADLGGRISSEHRLYPARPAQSRSDNLHLYLLPTLRLGVTF